MAWFHGLSNAALEKRLSENAGRWSKGGKISQGMERSCYWEAHDRSKVLKISDLAEPKQTLLEIAFFEGLVRKQVPFDYIPRYFGPVRIDGHLGLVQAAVVTGTGEPAPMLEDYVKAAASAGERRQRLATAIALCRELEQYLIRYNILVCDLHARNILLTRQDGRLHPWIIDGLGYREFIPLPQIFPAIGKRKIQRHVEKLISKLEKLPAAF